MLTPLNNILYNAKVENLKEHGLHPRYLHFLVNFPLLYGPLSTGTLVSLLWRPRLNTSLYYGNSTTTAFTAFVLWKFETKCILTLKVHAY